MQPFLHPEGYIECRTLEIMTVEFRNDMLIHTIMGKESALSSSILTILQIKTFPRNCGYTF